MLRENEMKHFTKGVNLTLSLVYNYLLDIRKKYKFENLAVYFDNCGG